MIIWNFLNQHLTDWVVLFIPVCPLSLGACLGLSLVWNWKWMMRENTQGGLGGGGWGVGGRPKFQILFTENHTGNCNLHCGTARGVKAYCLAGQCFTMWDRGSQIKLTEIICWVYSLFGVCGFWYYLTSCTCAKFKPHLAFANLCERCRPDMYLALSFPVDTVAYLCCI